MLSKHNIELIVDGQSADLDSGFSLRINNVLYQPSTIVATAATYSYSFSLQATPNNNRILGFSNILSVPAKFLRTYEATLSVDGIELFSGELVLTSTDASGYRCNLVIKNEYNSSAVFGDAKLTDAEWLVDYSGATTVNAVNADQSKGYFFPLVCYGAFQKVPVSRDEVSANYTSKFEIDQYNRWYYTSFMPSLSVTETLRKLFEWKGFTVDGNIFSDAVLSRIYASTNFASEQKDRWNIGNPLFGSVSLSWNFSSSTLYMMSQELEYPYYRITNPYLYSKAFSDSSAVFNFTDINIWNMLAGNETISVSGSANYIYNPEEHLIVVPEDGWYKINLSVNASLDNAGSTIYSTQNTSTFTQGRETETDATVVSATTESSYFCPFEIQLVKNYDEDVELIKGSKNIIYGNGNPNDATFYWRTGRQTNRYEWLTAYPHEDLQQALSPTRKEGLVVNATKQNTERSTETSRTTADETATRGSRGAGRGNGAYSLDKLIGYVPTGVMNYDPAVSKNFICGFSSMADGTVSVIKDGRSWTKLCGDRGESFATVSGYNKVIDRSGQTESEQTSYGSNIYRDSSTFIQKNGDTIQGQVQCAVYLKKNDILEPMLIQRQLENRYGNVQLMYTTTVSCSLSITAVSERSEEALKASSEWGYNSPTEFPEQLNLFNFTNSEKTISGWISDICNAFNLTIRQNGKNITIDKNKASIFSNSNQDVFVDIDDRTAVDDGSAHPIGYPSRIGISYSVSDKELGFEESVPSDKINLPDWNKYGDSGSTLISISGTESDGDDIIELPFSYTYYKDFTFTDSGYTISLPIIEESRYMIDVLFGDTYEEALQHDGYSLAQRFWFRGEPVSGLTLPLASYGSETVTVAGTSNSNGNISLSYKAGENSLLSYFNIGMDVQDEEVQISCYLSPTEYILLLGGAGVKFDGRLYRVMEIDGYDPANANRTTLKLIG